MSQLANPDTPSDALAPQDEAWTCLLHLEMQVQLAQAFLIYHTTKLSTLHQTTNHIFQSLQALLNRDAFDSDMLKIAWVLSYIKAEWASTYALCIFWHPRGVGSFTDWAAFEKNFWAEFFQIDPAKSAALALRNREQYGQGKWTLDEYIDSFQAFVEQAAYPDGLQLCLTFQDGLHSTLMERINNLAKDHPDDEQFASWYKVAQNQWQLMEIQRELH
ncbi:hypothetical protein C0993_008132 [Termitomyces sp. T159_Od127]|nr:hypothetical protein C0993_008132 [Termitomyces sp. T159_Od127]